MITGVFAAAGRLEGAGWRELVLEQAPPDLEAEAAQREARALLERLAAGIARGFVQGRFEFEPLLPGEDTDLETRVQSLAEWCRGFLLGLVAGGLKDLHALSDRPAAAAGGGGGSGEALRDLIEIAEVELGEGEAGEAAERALTELIEYVRAAVTLVYEELHPRRA